jgi:hypothetical protein
MLRTAVGVWRSEATVIVVSCSVGIATRYGPDDTGFDSRQGKEVFFFFFKTSIPAVGPTQPTIQLVPGSFHVVKRPGPHVDHSPHSNAEVRNEWSCTSATSCASTALVGATYYYCYYYDYVIILLTVGWTVRG